MKELKIRVRNYKKIEEKLKSLGAEFVEELQAVDTYFNQPKGLVLKIVQDDRGDFLSKLKEIGGKFRILGKEEVKDVEGKIAELDQSHGIKKILKKKRRIWKLQQNIFDFNLIENVGDFLILKSENPKESILTKELGIKKLERITVPFSDLQNS